MTPASTRNIVLKSLREFLTVEAFIRINSFQYIFNLAKETIKKSKGKVENLRLDPTHLRLLVSVSLINFDN